MNWLEARFRRQFVPHGNAFLYRQFDREVVFDREDVEAFVDEWRRSWVNPLLWSMMLLFGVVVPGAIWLLEPGAWLLALPISVMSFALGIIQLSEVGRDVKEVALDMDSVGLGHGRPKYLDDLVRIALILFMLGTWRQGEFGIAVFLGGALIVSVAFLIRTFLKGRRQRAKIALTRAN